MKPTSQVGKRSSKASGKPQQQKRARAGEPASGESRPPGWAEANGFRPGAEHVEDEPASCGSAESGYHVPLPGVVDRWAWEERKVLLWLAGTVANASRLLGSRVLPKVASAFETAEFADLLWSAQAILESESDHGFPFGTRDDLAALLPGDIMGKESFRMVRFFSQVLCDRAEDIVRYGLPHAGPRMAAELADALALAEMIDDGRSEFRRKQREEREAKATRLQRLAWEKRARAWLWRDCWEFRIDSDFQKRDPGAEPSSAAGSGERAA